MKTLCTITVMLGLGCLVFTGCDKNRTICAIAPPATAVNFKYLDQKIWKFDNAYGVDSFHMDLNATIMPRGNDFQCVFHKNGWIDTYFNLAMGTSRGVGQNYRWYKTNNNELATSGNISTVQGVDSTCYLKILKLTKDSLVLYALPIPPKNKTNPEPHFGYIETWYSIGTAPEYVGAKNNDL